MYEIKGATELGLATAKAFYDRGVVFIDGSYERNWREGHIPNSIHLPASRDSEDPTRRRLTNTTLREVVAKTDEIVFCFYADGDETPWAPAKAIKWGYQNVYYYFGGAPAWKAAGYPIETGE